MSKDNKNVSVKKRSSNIELHKIVAMILITLSHCLPVYGSGNFLGWIDENNAILEVNSLVVLFLRHIGQVGNVIFVICAAWFLVDDKKVKLNKVLNILFDAFVISVVGLVVGMLFNVQFSPKSVLMMFFPTTSGINWFVGCYLLLYIFHGYINLIIENATQKALLFFVMTMTIIYLVICAALPDILYYSRLVCFVTVYLIVGYIKKYMPRTSENKSLNLKLFGVLAFLYIASILIFLVLAAKMEFLGGRALKMACTNYFIMIFMNIALFNIIRTIKLPYNKLINRISACSLVFYLITENCVFAGKLRPLIFQWIFVEFGYNYLPLWIIGFSILTFVTGILLSTGYQSVIGRATAYLSKKVEGILMRIADKVVSFFVRID